jgi:hypothetical protein
MREAQPIGSKLRLRREALRALTVADMRQVAAASNSACAGYR